MAAGLYLFHPPGRLELVLSHAISFAVYIGSLFAFEYFLRQLTSVLDEQFPSGQKRLPVRRIFLIAAYLAFIGSTAGLVGLVGPDVLVAVLVYLLSAMLLQSSRQRVGPAFCAAFGGLIGLCWLTKAAMLPIGLATLPMLAISLRKRRRAIMPLLCTLAALAVVCLPFLVAIRITKGHWTLGKAGMLTYSWEVGGVKRFFHWQGGPGDQFGRPLHPTRQISASPPAYEFSTPLPVTYAPWFDPAQWHEGIRVHFDPVRQARAFGINFGIALILLVATPGVIPAAVVWWRGDFVRLRAWWRMTAGAWVLCLTSILLYSCVFVEPRYIGGMLAVMSCLLLGPALLGPPSSIPGGRWFTAWCTVPCVWFYGRPLLLAVAILVFEATGMEPYENMGWKEAKCMQSIGVRPGDGIAVIGSGFNAYWARLAGVRVVAEIPVDYEKRLNLAHSARPVLTSINTFWSASPERQQELLSAFARAGARWVVAEPIPMGVSVPNGWTQLPLMKVLEDGSDRKSPVFVRRLGS
ncbi:MAG TPA: hypothetical protein VGH38_23980 [Bryobacteraceae bacterium]